MRYLAALLATATCAGALAAPDASQPHDGTWLQNGLGQYQRLAANESLSSQQALEARTVAGYVCAVVEMEKHLVQRAKLLSSALRDGQRRRQPIDAQLLAGMERSLPMIIPMMATRLLASDPSCEDALPIVSRFLESYPEVLHQDADTLIEKSLLDAYRNAP